MSDPLVQLFILVDNYTLYKMSAIITSINDLSKGIFSGSIRVKTNRPGTVEYTPTYPGISEYIRELLDIFETFEEPNIYHVYDPTSQQISLLNTFFTVGHCCMWRTSGTMQPTRLVWEWIVKTDDLNLRTKAGRTERDARRARMIVESLSLLGNIKALMTPEFIEQVSKQEQKERLEYDVLIPTGKKHARELMSNELDALLKKMDRGGYYTSTPVKVCFWKTPSDVLHIERVTTENLNESTVVSTDGLTS